MPDGKPAGIRCSRLTDDNRCQLFDNVERPLVCRSIQASVEMCGASAEEALQRLTEWELATKPGLMETL
jgi:hypothetical protein